MKDAIFSSAKISTAMARNMLTRNRIKSMLSATSAMTAAKILADCGYNEMTLNKQPLDEDAILENERIQTLKTFNDLCTDTALAFCINTMFEYRNYESPFNETLIKLYQKIAENIPNIKNHEIQKYFRADADILNMRTYAKCRLAKTAPTNLIAAGGFINHKILKIILTGAAEEVRAVFAGTPYAVLSLTLSKAINRDNLSVFEEAANEFLYNLACKNKNDIFSVSPLFYWYILKQTEFFAVKIILSGKNLGLTKEQIMDNLRGLYERFK